jgi:hypothetical protein
MAAHVALGSQANSAAGSAISMIDAIIGALSTVLPVILFIMVRHYWAVGLLAGNAPGKDSRPAWAR